MIDPRRQQDVVHKKPNRNRAQISRQVLYFLVLQLICVDAMQAQQLRLMTWNIKDFGRSRDLGEMEMIAGIVNTADLVAIQEVVAKDPGGVQAIERLATLLNGLGSLWEFAISNPTNSSSPQKSERYAFLWKAHKAQLIGKPRLLREVDDFVEREPFLAKFRVDSFELICLNYHSMTHQAGDPETIEIEAISNWLLFQEPKANLFWMGDFNLDIRHWVYQPIISKGFNYLVNDEPTTLKMKCEQGNYFSLGEDNILFQCEDCRELKYEIVDFVTPDRCHQVFELRNALSDHLPVVVEFNLR